MTLPRPDEVLPHRGPMCWLHALLDADDTTTVAEVRPNATHVLADSGRLPGVAAVEWIAQTAAAHAGLQRRRHHQPAEPGVITSIRACQWPADGFALDTAYRVRVTLLHGADDPLAAFSGVVLNGDTELATATVHVLRGTLVESP